jgi:hypothetical protein
VRPPLAGRYPAALAAITTLLVLGSTPGVGGPASASTFTLSPAHPGARPGAVAAVHGHIAAACAGRPITVTQHYLNSKAARASMPGLGGVVGAGGAITFTVTVPNDAVRSDIGRPFSEYQYDVIEADVAGCGERGTNLLVLPFNRKQHISWSPTRPRSGSTISVTSTHCVGGLLSPFAQVIDRRGAYYNLSGRLTGTTFHGTVNLAHGFFGSDAPTGAAKPSARGHHDAILRVPCAQSEGSRAVARADHLQRLTWAVDFSIRRRVS